MGNLNKYFKKHTFEIAVCTFSVLMEAFCDVLQPTIMALIINNGIAKQNLKTVIILGIIMLITTFLGAIFASIRNIASSRVSQKLGGEVRYDMFLKVLNLETEKQDLIGTGSIVNRLTNDVHQLTELINKTLRKAIKAPAVCIGSIILSAFLSGTLAAIFLASSLTAFVVLYFCMKLSYRRFYKVQTAIDRIATVLEEYLKGVRLVKSFGQHDFEKQRFERANDGLFSLSVSAQRIISVFTPFISLSIYYGIAVVLLVGSRQVELGNLNVGSIAAFISYMLIMLSSLTSISNVANIYARSKASVERISEILKEETKTDNITAVEMAENMEISFENVTFSYPNSSGEPVLKNLNFRCKKGETLVIIGATGAGKSTILSLLLGLYENYKGTIKVGGRDIRSISKKSLRESMAIAPQKSMLFSGSILSNLKWGRETAEEHEIEKAVKTAQAEEFIKRRQDGYESILSQAAVNISGGQKQRLSVARALIKNSDILLFDDATGALDVLTESKVLKNLKENYKDKTKIIITQRICVAKQADLILVMENGEAVGLGEHEKLYKTCQTYRDICISQLGKQVKK